MSTIGNYLAKPGSEGERKGHEPTAESKEPSGGARWNFLAAWEYGRRGKEKKKKWKRGEGGGREGGLQRRGPVLVSRRAAARLTTFCPRRERRGRKKREGGEKANSGATSTRSSYSVSRIIRAQKKKDVSGKGKREGRPTYQRRNSNFYKRTRRRAKKEKEAREESKKSQAVAAKYSNLSSLSCRFERKDRGEKGKRGRGENGGVFSDKSIFPGSFSVEARGKRSRPEGGGGKKGKKDNVRGKKKKKERKGKREKGILIRISTIFLQDVHAGKETRKKKKKIRAYKLKLPAP